MDNVIRDGSSTNSSLSHADIMLRSPDRSGCPMPDGRN